MNENKHATAMRRAGARMTTAEVRTLDDGATVVDFGAKWFRVERDGTVIAKQAVNVPGQDHARIERRPATWRERAIVRRLIARAAGMQFANARKQVVNAGRQWVSCTPGIVNSEGN